MIIDDLQNEANNLINNAEKAKEWALKTAEINPLGIETCNQLQELMQFIQQQFIPALNACKENNLKPLESAIKDLTKYLAWIALPPYILDSIRLIIHLCELENNNNDILYLANITYNIGKAYYKRRTDTQNLAKANFYFQKALVKFQKLTKNDSADAHFTLALMYEKGHGVKKNINETIAHYKKVFGILKGTGIKDILYITQCKLAHVYIKIKTYGAAIELLKEAMQSNFVEAQSIMGYLYHYGYGVNKNLKTAREYYEKTINSQTKEQKYWNHIRVNLALVCEEENDFENAIFHYKYLITEFDDADAHFQLGKLYEFGIGIELSKESAFKHYSQAIIKENNDALLGLGRLNETFKNYTAAANLYERAIKINGDAEAYYRLGQLYERGLGFPENLKLAIEQYEVASGLNYADATFQLAKISDDKNKKSNIKNLIMDTKSLYQLAFNQYLEYLDYTKYPPFQAHAYFQLGEILFYGNLKNSNNHSAKEYYLKAKNLGHELADTQIRRITSKKKSRKTQANHQVKLAQTTDPVNSTIEIAEKECLVAIATPLCADEILNQYFLFLKNREYDKALAYLQDEKQEKLFKDKAINQARYLWAIADCLNFQFRDSHLTDQTLKEKLISALNTVAIFAHHSLRTLANNSNEYAEFQSIINLLEMEIENAKNSATRSHENFLFREHEQPTPYSPPIRKKKSRRKNKKGNPKPFILNYTIPINSTVADIFQRIKQANANCFIDGGYVRDYFLHQSLNYPLKVNDTDIICDLTPEQIAKLFANNSQIIGKRFPIVLVHCKDEVVEITSFRSQKSTHTDELQYNENGMIIRNTSYGNLYTDFILHDFTINALYYDPENKTILDFVDGINDLKNKIIRFIMPPTESIQVDPLRILRGIRFAAKLDFQIEESATIAMETLGHLLRQINPSRLYLEISKLFKIEYGLNAFKLLKQFNLLNYIFGANAAYINENLLEIIFKKSFNEKIDKITNDFDFILCAILLEAVHVNLTKFNNISYLAIQHTLAELECSIKLPPEIHKSVTTIFLIYLLPTNSVLASNKTKLHIQKADLLQKLMQNANIEIAKQTCPPSSAYKNADLLQQFGAIQNGLDDCKIPKNVIVNTHIRQTHQF